MQVVSALRFCKKKKIQFYDCYINCSGTNALELDTSNASCFKKCGFYPNKR